MSALLFCMMLFKCLWLRDRSRINILLCAKRRKKCATLLEKDAGYLEEGRKDKLLIVDCVFLMSLSRMAIWCISNGYLSSPVGKVMEMVAYMLSNIQKSRNENPVDSPC